MRTMPADILTIEKMGNHEIAYQAEEDLSDRYYYPDNYAIGRINDAGDGYEYIVYVVGISPIDEYEYVKSILDQFESDTTYVDVLLKEDDKIRANIYRKTKSTNALNMNFMMWKWVETPYGSNEFKKVKVMNLGAFGEEIIYEPQQGL